MTVRAPLKLKPAEPSQLVLVDVATREPFHRRTFAPVHRDSRSLGSFEATWWKGFDPKDKHRFMVAARRYDRDLKKPGDRRGPLGSRAVEVLYELLQMVDFTTGRLDPALTTLAERCRMAKSTIVDALDRLRRHGFVSWVRRFAPTGRAGVRGPQVEQASNAYRLSLPERALRMIKRLSPPKTPECFEAERSARAAAWRKMAGEDETPGADRIARTANGAIAVRKARDAGLSASRTSGLNPGSS